MSLLPLLRVFGVLVVVFSDFGCFVGILLVVERFWLVSVVCRLILLFHVQVVGLFVIFDWFGRKTERIDRLVSVAVEGCDRSWDTQVGGSGSWGN